MKKETYELDLGIIEDKFDTDKINDFIEAVKEKFEYEDTFGGQLKISETKGNLTHELQELYDKAKEFVSEDFADNIKLGTKTLKETIAQ